jgi:hypothetical protein
MPHLTAMNWNHYDQLRSTSQQVVTNGDTSETTYYAYNADGQRARKATERQAAPWQTPVKLKERVYFGQFETYREFDEGGILSLEKETLSVMDDQKRVALIETRTHSDNPNNLPTQLTCF